MTIVCSNTRLAILTRMGFSSTFRQCRSLRRALPATIPTEAKGWLHRVSREKRVTISSGDVLTHLCGASFPARSMRLKHLPPEQAALPRLADETLFTLARAPHAEKT